MCDFKSGIIFKDRVFVPDHGGHSEMHAIYQSAGWRLATLSAGEAGVPQWP